jgi:hypothetical protein
MQSRTKNAARAARSRLQGIADGLLNKFPNRATTPKHCGQPGVGRKNKGGNLVKALWTAAAGVLAVALIGPTAASATVGVRQVERSPSAKLGQVPSAAQTIADHFASESVLLRPRAAKLLARPHRFAPLAHSAFGGLALCVQGVLEPADQGELIGFPVADSGHDGVITFFVLVRSTSPDFTTGVETFTHPFGAIQFGGDFYNFDVATGQIVRGPTTYDDAWAGWWWDYPTDYYEALLTVAVFYDDGVFSAPVTYVASAYGPFANSSFSCHN